MGVYADAGQGSEMGEDLYSRFGKIWCPESNAAVLVTEMHNGVVVILCQCVRSAKFGAVNGDLRSGSRVGVRKMA